MARMARGTRHENEQEELRNTDGRKTSYRDWEQEQKWREEWDGEQGEGSKEEAERRGVGAQK